MLTLNLSPHASASGHNIRIVVTFDRRHRKTIRTPVYINADEWDAITRQIKPANKRLLRKQAVLNKLKYDLEEWISEQLLQGREINAELIKEYQHKGTTEEVTVNRWISEQIELDGSLKDETKQNHRQTLAILDRFNDAMSWSDINYNTIKAFDNYLRSEGYAHNTIDKHHRHLRRYLYEAIKSDIEINQPYIKFKSTSKLTDKTALSTSEIESIEVTELEGRLDWIRDVFLFQCYTGLAFVDLFALTHQSYRLTNDGYKLVGRRGKTGGKYIIPCYNPRLFDAKGDKLLARFIDGSLGKPYVIPPISNPEYNRYLKVLANECEVETHLTTHVARHTFITHALVAYDMNKFKVMQMAGIRKLETMRVYEHLAEEMVEEILR